MNSGEPRTGYSGRALLLAFVAGGCALGVLLAVAAVATVEFGLYDTTATKEHGPLASWAAHSTFIHATRRAAQREPTPKPFSPTQVEAGARLYAANCEVCHGGPATPRAAWVAGINPTPPFLLDSARRWSPAELHAIISEGVKMTAMPAWRYTLSDAERWDIVAFLDSLPETPPAHYGQAKQAWRAPSGETSQ